MIILFLFTEDVAETLPVDSSRFFYDKTFLLIRKCKFDSALISIRQAYAYGLTDDSLCYAWAEIYNAKGALDTAIALNLAVKSKPGHPLYYPVLKQRYFIYTLTNQKDKADKVFDTLSSHSKYRLKYLIPEMSLYLGGGVQQNSTKEAEILPSYLGYAYPQNEPPRGMGSGNLNLQWSIPLRNNTGFQVYAGATCFQYNPPDPFKLKKVLDSSYSQQQLKISFYALSGIISGDYEISRFQEWESSTSFRHKVDLSVAAFLKNSFVFGTAGYNYNRVKDVHNWNVLLFGNRDWSSRRANSVSVSVNGIHMKEDTFLVRDTYLEVYTDGENLFLDSMLTHPVKYLAKVLSNTVNDIYYTTFPRSYITTKLSFMQQFNFKNKFAVSISIDGLSNHFVGYYAWVDSLYNTSDIPRPNDIASLVVNVNNNMKYWATSLSPLKFDSIQPFTRTVHKKKRVDQTITANVSFKKDIKRIASIGLSGSVSRTFSSLSGDDAVVDVPVWAYSVMLSTTVKFNPSGRLR
ncbi:MAG TPA: hypothetical protein VHO70_23780 [Chitinispirillaceae bacterium]|nr:hypothetical protein [Chitinispirillaceae bacterium]